MAYNTDSSRWQALQTRDKAAHNAFVYAVTTTHIYCRPTCPSRLARRANVVYFDVFYEAVAAGYRACKRCKPDQNNEANGSMVSVEAARSLIEWNCGQVSIAEAASAAGVTTRHLHTLFKNNLGCTPASYATEVRKHYEIQLAQNISSIQEPFAMSPATEFTSNDSDLGSLSPLPDEAPTPALDPDVFKASIPELEGLLGLYDSHYTIQLANELIETKPDPLAVPF